MYPKKVVNKSMIEYPVKGEKIEYVSDEKMDDILCFLPKWKRKLIGGCVFVESKRIYIREKRRDDIKLLNHERGHIRGYKHTWLPTLMFPSWIGRILNRYNPVYYD